MVQGQKGKISVYDIETLANVFSCTFLDIKTKEVRSFLVTPWVNEWALFAQYYLSHGGLIGFNNVDFDERVVHPFLDEADKYSSMSGEELVILIKKRANEVIKEDFKEQRVPPHVPQRDLFKIWHFNNKARMTSLKYLQINMGWKDCREMPFAHDSVLTPEQIPELLSYNLNDCESTLAFYHLSKDKIRLRNKLGEKYGVNMGNFNDGKIGEAIFLKEISKRTGRTERDIRSRNTPRKNIVINDLLVPGIMFKSAPFNKVLSDYKKMVVTSTKKAKKQALYCNFDGVQYEFGFGGIHACRGNGLYHNVTSADVSSYYPNIAIKNRIYPLHLGPVYCDVYDLIYQERRSYDKESDESKGLKLTLNIPFGQSNSKWSIFYDPLYTMSITVNGQLLLAMLCERLTLEGAGKIIMANTDGIELDLYDKAKFDKICQEWQDQTRLTLEFSKYTKLFIRDVNAYVGLKEKGEPKLKNDFEIEKEIYKDQSMRIVPIAVLAYFQSGTPVEETIRNCKDISKFLLGKRAKTGNLEYRDASSGQLVKQKLPKNVRYFISRTGGSIVKLTKLTDKQKKKEEVPENQLSMFGEKVGKIKGAPVEKVKVTSTHKGYRKTLFNKWFDVPFDDYGVELQFYVREANKLINSVLNNQTEI